MIAGDRDSLFSKPWNSLLSTDTLGRSLASTASCIS